MWMTHVAVAQHAIHAIDDGIQRADEHLRRVELFLHADVEATQHLRWIIRALRVNRRRAHGQRHDERRLIAVSGDVADHDADTMLRESIEIVEISADVFRGNDERCNRRLWCDVRGIGQELHLQVVRELHLLLHALLVERLPDEPSVLDGGADLAGDCGDELLVASSERLSGPSVGEIHDTERSCLHPAQSRESAP